jgi:hypothetical protein
MDLYLGQYRFPLTLEQLIYLSKTCLNLILFSNAEYIVIHDKSNNCHRVLTYFALLKYLQGCNATLLNAFNDIITLSNMSRRYMRSKLIQENYYKF